MIRKLFVLNMLAWYANILRSGRGGKKRWAGAERAHALLAALLMLILVLSVFGLFIGLFSTLTPSLFEMGLGWLYFALFAVIVFTLSVVSTVFSASGMIFRAKDNELLLSLPIKPSAILMSRLLVFLTTEYALALLVFVAALVPWIASGYATAGAACCFVAATLCLPLMATAISLLFAWLLSLILARIRFKNAITLLAYGGFILLYYYLYSHAETYVGELLAHGVEIAEAFRQGLPPFYLFGIGVNEVRIVAVAQFALWAVLPFAAAVGLLSMNFRKVLAAGPHDTTKVVYTGRQLRTRVSSSFVALLRKEFAYYRSQPLVILNSSTGSLAMIVGAVYLMVNSAAVLPVVASFASVPVDLNPALLVAILLTGVAAMNNLGAALISLEGKQLWIAQSIPVTAQTVLAAKVCFSLAVSALPCLFAAVCAGVLLGHTVSDWLLLLVLPQAFIALSATSGLAINLRFPKLNWVNEMSVVKRGAAPMITLFGGMAVIGGLALLYAFLLVEALPVQTYLWLCALFFAIGAAFLYAWLMKSGASIFANLTV
ncbi:MAG: hypothetical protein LBJ07_00060 [Actinomycetes bacterium]|jgi:ABC-2 type transport system permease protein|nr:hypothetical protein [Actinomycetes bacterium]